MDPTSGSQCFNGTIFHVWKGNRPCRIYIARGQVYFIRRAVGGIAPGTAAVIGSQFGLLGGLAVGLAGVVKAKTSADFVRDDDPRPPDQLVSKHADNYAIAISDIIDARIEPKGKHTSYGMNAGRWHFIRRGDAKETVVLLESLADASRAVFLLGAVLGRRLRNDAGIVGAPATDGTADSQAVRRTDRETASDLVTGLALPSEHADVADAMRNLTQLLGEQAPPAWQTVRCEVRVAPPGSPGALEIIIADGNRPDVRRPTVPPPIYQAATRVARKLSPSVSAFPGLVIEMTRLDQGGWHINATLTDQQGAESRTPERKQLGQQRLGAPISATFDALVSAVDQKPWTDFRREPVGYYFSKMIGWWLLRLMDSALSDTQLQAVAPEEVKAVTLLLFRDMFRHNSRLLRPQTADAGWVDELFKEVAADLELPPIRLRDDGQPYEIDDIDNAGWARRLAAPFGIPAEKLFACHSAIVTGAQEEFGAGR
jgi:hypothetical protein